MLQWFRARVRSVGTTALLSLVTLTVWSAMPHQDDCHDAICAVVVPHDPSAHSVGRADTSHGDRPLHCVLCHWTRIARPSTHIAHYLTPAVDRTVRFLVDIVVAPETFFAAQPPLRGPPASPALAV